MSQFWIAVVLVISQCLETGVRSQYQNNWLRSLDGAQNDRIDNKNLLCKPTAAGPGAINILRVTFSQQGCDKGVQTEPFWATVNGINGRAIRNKGICSVVDTPGLLQRWLGIPRRLDGFPIHCIYQSRFNEDAISHSFGTKDQNF